MATLTQAESVVEGLVAYWFAEHGYSARAVAGAPGSTFVEARGSKSLLVQVKWAVRPDTPDELSAEEARDLSAREASLGSEPWEARVRLDERLEQLGEIQWRKLA